ncbi:hypothetical protein DY000_02064087 [Brassica cretica]|uniref:Uncharacterized protein n=1 Tax=Brassica cretica TaxID=69181 RepID=A0ABQ7B3G1_BRACR|nr:hypothetical protein DY000_02064087 [Brassica cretica]
MRLESRSEPFGYLTGAIGRLTSWAMRSHSLFHPHVNGSITTCGQNVRAQAELFYHVEVVGSIGT